MQPEQRETASSTGGETEVRRGTIEEDKTEETEEAKPYQK